MPRINITIDDATLNNLHEVATHSSKSISETAKDLIVDAIDSMEDMALSRISDNRINNSKSTFSHKEAWK